MTLDQAVQSFKSWCQGDDGMDELEFKEYITERYTAEKVLEGKIEEHGFLLTDLLLADANIPEEELAMEYVNTSRLRYKLLQAELSKLKE